MATHSSILAWKIPWTAEPGGLSLWVFKESDMTEHVHAHTHAHTCTHMYSPGTIIGVFTYLISHHSNQMSYMLLPL